MRVIVSLLVAATGGLAVVFFILAYLLVKQADGSPFWVTGLPFFAYLDLIVTAPIWMPLAPIAAVCAYYACYAKLSARNETSRAYGAGALPGWKILRATAIMYLIMAAAIVAWFGEFAYRKNYICGPGEHIIQSDADAIKQAQLRIVRARYDSHGMPGYIDEKPSVADFSSPDCCTVKRTLTWGGVIVWEVLLSGETIGEPKKRHVSAFMSLSNCGAVFDVSSISAEPIR